MAEWASPSLNLFSQLSRDEFVRDYWQQKPCIFRQALPGKTALPDGHELAGLACEDAVESRIVEGSGIDGPWHCRQGPFPDLDYDSLGPVNWTLLVQGVDQWDDSVRQLMHQFSFLPRWRLEDVMASFAPRGGGVGPHFDYYDVFLIQSTGRRRWEVGAVCNDQTALQDHAALKLLPSFDCQASYELDAGDAIYIPAGWSHWGVSLSDDCITLSVGFRAPSTTELLTEAVELLARQSSQAQRYQDPAKGVDEDPFCVNAAAQQAAMELVRSVNGDQLQAAVGEALGRLVTDTRYCSFNDKSRHWSPEDVREALAGTVVKVKHQPHCRMAYSATHLFVNGEAFEADQRFSKALCHGTVDYRLTLAEHAVVAQLLNDDMIELDSV